MNIQPLLNSLSAAMLSNAAFSAICGLMLIFADQWWAQQFNQIDPLWITSGGAVLLVFSMQLLVMVKLKLFAKPLIYSVIASDLLYVAFALTLSAIFFGGFSLYGVLFLWLTALVVFDVALWQHKSYTANFKK